MHTHSHPRWCEGLPGTNAEGAALTWLGERGVWEGMGCAMWPPQWSVGPAFSRPHLVCAGATPPSPQCHPMRAKAERIRGACLSNTVTRKKNSWREPSPRQMAMPWLLLSSERAVSGIMRKGDYQQLLGSRRKASVLKVRRGGNQKVGVAVLLQPRKGGLRQTVSSSLMSQISAAWVS